MPLKYFLLFFALCGTALGNEEKCFSSVVCDNGESEYLETSWILLFPSPECKGSKDGSGNLEEEYNTSLQNFILDMNDDTSNELSTRGKESNRCFLPVVCTTAKGSQTDWLMVFGSSCEGGITNEKSTRISDDYRKLAYDEAMKKANETCGSCPKNTTDRFDSIFGIKNTSAKEEPNDCFAPVICSNQSTTNENWMKVYPSQECDGSPAKVTTVAVSMAKRAFDESLQKAIGVYRDIESRRCAGC